MENSEQPSEDNHDRLGHVAARFVEHGVAFVVIGGWSIDRAFPEIGYRTDDLDLVVAASEENYERIAAALNDLQVREMHRGIPRKDMEAVEKIAAAALPGGPLDTEIAAGLARGDDGALAAAEDDVCRRIASTGHATMLDWEADTSGGVLFCAYGTAGDAEGNTDTVDIVFGAKGCGDDEDEFIEHSCTLLARPDPERLMLAEVVGSRGFL